MTQIIKPKSLAAMLGVHPETIRRKINGKELPGFDVQLTRKTRGWFPETLRNAGVNIPKGAV